MESSLGPAGLASATRAEGSALALSVVVPAYNEARRIVEPLRRIHDYLAAQPYSSEIVIVDDGSEDGTFEIVRSCAPGWKVPVRAFRYERNGGKGYALKVGFAQARGERILFTDADLSTPIEHTEDLIQVLDGGADVAIGSRRAPGAEIVLHQSWLRERLGTVFTLLVRRLIADVSDATCGFKAFRREAGKEIFGRVRIHDWSFDAEVLLIARQMGYRIEVVPVRWEDRAGTKVRLLRDVLGSIYGLLRIRLNLALGLYRKRATLSVETGSWRSDPLTIEASTLD
jgi:dolichyl-phosphate beta-glucosyltransferase